MPLPTPGKGESRSDFMSRCLGDEHVRGEFTAEGQAAAVCQGRWEDHHKAKASAHPLVLPVYQDELPLRDRMLSSRVLAWCSPLREPSPGEVAFTKRRRPDLGTPTFAKAAQNDFDLYPLVSVLVSVGWNKNDHVFDPTEVWKARATPEDKPTNYCHDAADIIGHTVRVWAVDRQGNQLPDDLPVDKLPPSFHLMTADVLYRQWEREGLQERMDRILAEIARGEWFVSMECLFADFDYALISPQSEKTVLPRNEKTSFLTAQLRHFGGEGVFRGYRVGMLLKDLVFSGKGLVKHPANPESVILANAEEFPVNCEKLVQIPFVSVYAVGGTLETNTPRDVSEKRMSDDYKKLLDEARGDLGVAKAEAAAARAERDSEKHRAKATEDAAAREREETGKRVDLLKAEVEALKKDRETLTAEAAALKKAATDSAEALAKTVADRDRLKAELEGERQKARREARLRECVTAGMTQEEAAPFADATLAVADDTFALLLAPVKARKVVSAESGKRAEAALTVPGGGAGGDRADLVRGQVAAYFGCGNGKGGE